MTIPSRCTPLSAYKAPEITGENGVATQILKAVQGLEIDTAIGLLEWCSRRLLHQKCEISADFLQDIFEST